jgi:hypothetical protein
MWRKEKDGQADGLWKEWYINGNLKYRANWKNGLGHGKWEYFYPNGQLESVSFYIRDQAQGLYLSYHTNGQLAKSSIYLNGQLDGEVLEYDQNGTQTRRTFYKSGEVVVDKPTLFLPGIISTEEANEWDITFTPDLQTAYFTRRLTDGSPQKIYQSKKLPNGSWSKPEVAAFSIDRDEGAFVSPDGSQLIFASCRPINPDGGVQDLDMNLWSMDKTNTGWSEPKQLTGTVNKERMANDKWPEHYEAGPTIDQQGNLYYWTKSSTANVSNLYRAFKNKKDNFSSTEELIPPSSNQGFDSTPVVTPDGQYLFFASSNRNGSYGQEDLYYTRLTDDQWSEPKNLGSIINSQFNESAPRFSPDGKYFFFASDRTGKVDQTGEPIWSIYYIETQYLILEQ